MSAVKEVSVSKTHAIMNQLVLPNDTNTLGNLHGGRVMYLMDICAAMSAYRLSRSPVVTASVDRLDFLSPAQLGDMLILRSSVNYTGKTSMEVGVRIESENPQTGDINHTATAYMTFVALDSSNKPTSVPNIKPETDDEYRRFEEAKIRHKLNKQRIAE